MNISEQVRLLRQSKHVHSNWYRETYPEVARLNIEPALHYLRYGAAMGRNPGKHFNTRFYLHTYPDAAQSGMNPLLHYVLHGKDKGYVIRPPQSPGAKHVATLRTKLLSLGFTERPLQELADLHANADAPETRALAARELALWHMRLKTPEGYRRALAHLAAARADAPDLDFRRKLAVAELLCHYFLDDGSEGRASYERAALAGEVSPDLWLSRANFETRPEGRLALMNRVLCHYGIPPIALLPGETLSPYDRLTSAGPLDAVTGGPKVTVLIAAYDAAGMLPTALRSLQEQTWKNLEIIVLDDCSPSPDTIDVALRFAKADPRIRVIRMDRNGGAYVARNRGLDEATGDYVTLHDADDWSHPKKIETQVRFMEENPAVMGCTSEQARMTSRLEFPKWAGPHGTIRICKENVSSFMQRHKPVFDMVGYWDSVRFGADSEKMRRVRAAFGDQSIVSLKTGPLSFQRISESSIVSDGEFGVDGFFFGARLAYMEGQLDQLTRRIKYTDPANNQFPVPTVMRADRKKFSGHYDVIIASEFRMHGGSTRSNLEEITCHAREGLHTGIVQMNRYDYPANARMIPEVYQTMAQGACSLVSHGESVTCDLLIVRYPPVLEYFQRYMPEIEARNIRVIVNQPPMSDYGANGVRRYHLKSAAENIRNYFGKDATWHPIGPLVRDVLHEHHASELHHIDLSGEDWTNIIDISGWDRGRRPRGPGDKLRIGRHSRDHQHKWPNTRESVLAAYPATDDIEVHVLGGATAPEALIGKIPKNWTVHEFGSMHPRDFLKDIDVWIYFSHPDWLESFGRTIIEAMAAGVPVILPEEYRPLFQDAAIYATPQTAVEIARKLHADKSAYDAQVMRAQSYVEGRFSYTSHLERIGAGATIQRRRAS